MHPPLVKYKHPHCKEQIEALIDCHKNNPTLKFFGVCNEQKWALDRCFREEKVLKRKISLEKARQEQQRLKERLQKKAQNKTDTVTPGYSSKPNTASN